MCNEIPVVDLKATGRNIQQLREERGLSVKDLQRILGFANPQAVYKWQTGCCLSTFDNLLILSDVFGVPIEKIIVCGKCCIKTEDPSAV